MTAESATEATAPAGPIVECVEDPEAVPLLGAPPRGSRVRVALVAGVCVFLLLCGARTLSGGLRRQPGGKHASERYSVYTPSVCYKFLLAQTGSLSDCAKYHSVQVDEEDDCKSAAAQLGVSWGGRKKKNCDQRPVGCYYAAVNEKIYYNSCGGNPQPEYDPSSPSDPVKGLFQIICRERDPIDDNSMCSSQQISIFDTILKFVFIVAAFFGYDVIVDRYGHSRQWLLYVKIATFCCFYTVVLLIWSLIVRLVPI